jgi:hypothetical protein
MPNTDHHHKLTVEDLLRLKRAERPPVEFWARFESDLRQRQLVALLDRRPWWHALLARRVYLPVGATAVLAFTLLSVRYYAPVSVALTEGRPTDVAEAAGPVRTLNAPPAAVLASEHSVSLTPAQEESSSALVVDDRTAIAAVPLSERLPEKAAELTPWSVPAPADTPAARSIAATLAQLEQTEPGLAEVAFGGRAPAPQNRLQQGATQMAELAAVTAVASRRSRLLAQFNERHFTPEPQAPELVRERLSRRLADAEYNERFSRIGLKGDQVSLKF